MSASSGADDFVEEPPKAIRRRCQAPAPSDVFGVTMYCGVSAKIKDEARFTHWAWHPTLTPLAASSIFAQPGLHLSVLLITLVSNGIFFLLYHSATYYNLNRHKTQVLVLEVHISNTINFYGRLLTWLLAGYVAALVGQYYRGAKDKGGTMIAAMASFVGNIATVINRECDRAEEFSEDLWRALTCMGHYALAHAASNTKFKKSKNEMQDIFDSRGFDGKYLLSHQKKETATVIYNGILESLQEEYEKGGMGCLKGSFDSNRFVKVSTDLENLLEGVLRVISSMSANKLPYAYHQLIHWGVRNGYFLNNIATYWILALQFSSNGADNYPLSCFQTMISVKTDDDINCLTEEYIWFNVFRILLGYFILGCLEFYPTLIKTWEYSLVLRDYQDVTMLSLKPDVDTNCPTEEYIWFNVFRILLGYFILGCLELYPTLVKTWETSLVLKNYQDVVDCVCRPLKPGSERRSLGRMRLRKMEINS
ncbi:hypothetical protein ACHAWF_005496 [Thalassiosira exigua]